METRRVLIVDDDIDYLETSRRTLEHAGYSVLTASNGNDGFRLATENHVDLAVLDVMMETRQEGFELARRLRRDQRSAKIPLVLLTGVNEDNKAMGFSIAFSDQDRDDTWMPIDRFVDKPVSSARLVGLVRELAG